MFVVFFYRRWNSSTFEYEKGSNMEQVEELEEMEQKLILMAEEVEKVRRAIGKFKFFFSLCIMKPNNKKKKENYTK